MNNFEDDCIIFSITAYTDPEYQIITTITISLSFSGLENFQSKEASLSDARTSSVGSVRCEGAAALLWLTLYPRPNLATLQMTNHSGHLYPQSHYPFGYSF